MPYGDKPSSISSGVQYFFPGVLVLGPVPRQSFTDSPIDPLHRVFASNCESRHAGKGRCEWIWFTWCLKFQPNRYLIYKCPLSIAASWPQVHDHPISASWVVGITFGWPHTYTTDWAFLFFSSPLFSLCPLSFCLSFLVHWATLLLFLALTHLFPRIRWHGYVYLWMGMSPATAVCRGQRISCRIRFLFPPHGIELRSSGWVPRIFTHWVISPTQATLF